MRRTNTAKWDDKTKRWKIYVQKDNVRKTFYSSIKGKEGQREANAKADNWLENNITDTKLKVRKTVEKYMEQLRLTSSQSHCKQYEYYFNDWILPKIGDVRIEKVTEQQLQDIINIVYAHGLAKKNLMQYSKLYDLMDQILSQKQVYYAVHRRASCTQKRSRQRKKDFTARRTENPFYGK